MSLVMLPRARRLGKRLALLVWYAHNHGWSISFTRGGHLRLHKPGKPVVHTSRTPSDWRTVHNAIAMLARADAKN
ncbi:type II toxin-antitoxin system HicA family toxin [Pseudomonas sp. 2hn]|uniref:type II toxin-antitoxin system HicA family toxin n=1 Tax=Pseudomonas sp. 2hn TaxID=2866626 RepID=UPI00217EB1BF|nr:type II toxin-antitoxin system HicA family toxin [Pseudomonas sp. 2hn]